MSRYDALGYWNVYPDFYSSRSLWDRPLRSTGVTGTVTPDISRYSARSLLSTLKDSNIPTRLKTIDEVVNRVFTAAESSLASCC